MRNLKKFLALVLSMMMVLSLFVTASATSIKSSIDKQGDAQVFTDAQGREFQEAIDVLNGMEVLKGYTNADGTPNGEFGPDKPITRAEVAALVFRLATGMTGPNDADHYARYGSFSDVSKDAWYAGYVGYCANAGYIKGYAGETGPFGPSDNVTGYQALAMILRAMGYGVNGEFEGSNWQLNVSAIGTQTGILAGIGNSHFGNATLYGPAPREVVAQIYFAAANTGCVVYTPAYGYQTVTEINPSTGATTSTLGLVNFGLTETRRVIVANQDTGESATILGAPYSTSTPLNAAKSYAYPGSVLEWNEDGTAKTLMGDNLTLNVKTDLDMFGHKVHVWYNATDGKAAHQTYALYDEAKTTYVYAKDGDATANSDLSRQAAAAKLSVDPSKGFHVSDRYGWISNNSKYVAAEFAPINYSDIDANDTDQQVLIKTNKKDVADGDINVKEDTNTADNDDLDTLPYGSLAANPDGAGRFVYDNNSLTQKPETGSYYRLVSNSGSTVDLVITVAPELERVTEHDTTASVKTVRLSGQSDGVLDSATGYDGKRNDSTFGEKDDGFVRVDSLTTGSKSDIGSLVVGWEIKGTNYSVDYLGNVNKGNGSLYRYYLQPTADKITGTVKYYHADTGEVVLDTGNGTKTLYFTLLPIINYAVSPAWDPHTSNFYFYNNVQYTFTLDPTDSSRYVDWGQGNDYEFLYATYVDHKDGGLGTADLDYYVTGVKWDGTIVENAQFTTINSTPVSGRNYESLIVAKKNLGGATTTANANNFGNEVKSGWYAGYTYNAGTKDLDVDRTGDFSYDTSIPSNNNWYGYDINTRYWANKIHADYNNVGTKNGVWTIDRDDVSKDFSEQVSDYYDDDTGNFLGANGIGGLILTKDTKFIIVSGVGIGSNKTTVEIKNGIGELLGNSRYVTIDVKRYTDTDGDGIDDASLPEYNAYYKLVDDDFNNYYKESLDLAYSDDNYMVDTVILPKDAITWSDNTNLWFTNVTAPTGYYPANIHADSDQVEQYRMWHNGVEEKVLINWALSTDMDGTGWGTANGINADCDSLHGTRIGTFYELTEVGATSAGEKIYRANAMTSLNSNNGIECDNVNQTQNTKTICNIDLKYDYTAVNNLNTARLTARGRNQDVLYQDNSGNPLSHVYNVSGANVTNLASGGGNIKDIKSLNEAVSVGYRVTVAIVNDGIHVTQIYVTEVNAPGTWDPANPLD